MSQPFPRGSVSDRLAAAAAAALVGRSQERARLTSLLVPDGPAAVFVHGPGGIGKTTLVTGTLARLPLNCVSLDGPEIEPTVPGALAALGAALGGSTPSSATAAAEQIAAAGVDVLVIDRALLRFSADARPRHCSGQQLDVIAVVRADRLPIPA